MKSILALILSFLAVFNSVSGFYLPGVAPHSYEDGEDVDLKVNKLRFARSVYLPVLAFN